ncbi:plastoquinone biosynthesis coenzyme/ Coq4 family protein [Synechococcus sp. BIOS-E4-1]|uniref:Coq4 family protein n=1 Tax=Synechococcus sp. BIOS-E4-1 TaxID=1400864 RepID=UPI00164702D6|nr:Coq4 family protein [Synechococcus sp. BIOS-E4-1]QNI54201.1 plastoquinone biosynthesis coenzyme/ Coq4 family protein [Synechococcus sp. BIOS-E4-1]
MSETQNYVRSSFSDGATKLAVSILQTAKEPDKIFQHGRYFAIPGGITLQKECFERVLTSAKVQDVLSNRPSQTWPELEQMGAMPKGSLGCCLQQRMEMLGLCFLPEPELPEPESDEAFFISRSVRLHEIHHTVLGLPITVAGEAAASAFYASTGSMPFDISVLASWMLRGSYEPSERRLIWDGISFGIAVGQRVPELFSPRWEEGWERSIIDWQNELGITELLKTSPFQEYLATSYA